MSERHQKARGRMGRRPKTECECGRAIAPGRKLYMGMPCCERCERIDRQWRAGEFDGAAIGATERHLKLVDIDRACEAFFRSRGITA